MKTIITNIKLIPLTLLLLAGCGTNTEKDSFRIGFSQCLMGDDWRKVMYSEVQRELLFHEDIELVFRNADGVTAIQLQQIDELLEQDIDLLIVSPNEAEPFREKIEKVYNSGLPVILVDRKINSNLYTAFVGGNNRLIGSEAARYIGASLKGEGSVIEVYEYLSSTPFYERSTGFRETIDAYPGIMVDSVMALERGSEKFKDLLRDGNYDAVFAHTDVAAHFAYGLATEMGKEENIDFIGVDGLASEDGGLQLVNNGILKASLLYPTGGDVAIQVASDILHNRPFLKENELPTTLIDSANVFLMITQANKLLDQQEDIQKLGLKMDDLQGIFRNQKTLIYLLTLAVVISIVLTAFVFQSLVEKRRTYDELQFKNEQIIEISKKAEEATQAKFRFFTNISHEFRTPLTLMLGPIEELIRTESNPSVRRDLNFVQKNANRLLRLINQLMDFRKVENNKMKIKVSEQNIVEFLRDIMSSFDKVAKSRKIDFKLITETGKVNAWFDQDMLDKVFFNILSNAFKFTSDLGMIHVKVQLDNLNSLVRIVFEDDGKGMSKEQVQHAFERFYQGESHSTIEGTGLGLSLSKELISLHSGTIDLKSQLNKGTRFEIALPLGKEHFPKDSVFEETDPRRVDHEADVIKEEEYDPGVMDQFSTKELSLLIIEDNADLREFLNSKLSQFYQIIEAEDGESGLVKARQFIPDLVICDLMLPKKNGHEVLKALKSDLKTSHIPFILLTAKGTMDEKVTGIQEGADDFITKPFNFRFLAERIRMILLNRQKLREYYLHQLPADQSSPAITLDKKFANDFIAIVEENFSNPDFGVNELCEKMSLSRVQLYRKVKALLGYSVSDYINMVRLKKASYLIKNGNLSISEIAYQVGYSSPAYFSTAFKGHFGSTPTEYKSIKAN